MMRAAWEKWARRLERRQELLGVDFGARAVKFVQVDRRGGRRVMKHASCLDLPSDAAACADSASLGRAIAAHLRRYGVTARAAAAALGGRDVFMREIILPPLPADEIRAALEWEAERHVPFAPQEYYFDCAVVGRTARREWRVWLAAAARGAVDALTEALKNGGLRPAALDAQPFALRRTLRGVRDAVVADLGREAGRIILYQAGLPVASRNIPVFGEKFTECVGALLRIGRPEAERLKLRPECLAAALRKEGADGAMREKLKAIAADLAREIVRTIEYQQLQSATARVDQIVLTGGGACFCGLDQEVQAGVALPVVLHDPFQAMDGADGPADVFLRANGPRFAVAAGLALYDDAD